MSRRWLLLLLLAASAPAAAQTLSPGPLTRAHASLDSDDACEKCHASGRQVDDRKCLGCHEPLARQVSAGRGLHGVGFRGQECSKCHVEHLGRDARIVRWPGGAPEKLDHRKTGWPLEGKHQQTTCAKCHTGKTKEGRATYLGLATACASCHEDPHKGRFGESCAGCHKATAWKDVAIDKFDHAKTRYPLLGKHAAVTCAKCHGAPPRWQGLEFATCAACHQDPHKGKFARFACESCHSEKGWKDVAEFRSRHPGVRLTTGHARVACKDCHDKGNDVAPTKGKECVSCHKPVHEAAFGKNCESCHRQLRWLGLPREIGLEAHAKTAFPLRGRHPDVDCARCHDPKLGADKRFRQLTFDRCTGCHAEPHAAELTRRLGGGDCAPCHSERGFAPTTFTAALHEKTRYPLDGQHEAAPCSTCHTGKRPRLDLRLQAQACAECHANPHGEQFAAEMARGGCASCHATAGWERPKVDHTTWPLTGAHGQVACARCHGAVARSAGAAGLEAARYRGVPRTCDGCHADVHAGQFRLSPPERACESCHDTTRFALPGFDHAAKAGYALEGKHRAVACAKCHPQEKLKQGGTAVRWRLGYRACKDCHADPHGDPR